MAEKKRSFYLANREDDGADLRNWGGSKLEKCELDRLVVGDCVRLKLQATPEGDHGWEMIYFEISHVARYKKGGIHRPRTFKGIAMDTYRLDPYPLRFVQTGEEISFQRKNIFEIPDWVGNEYRSGAVFGLPPQSNMSVVDRDLEYMHRREQEMALREMERLRIQLREAKAKAKAAKTST